ncbi:MULTISPECIES: hypothetical protein [Alteribacter]|uniref:Uncharacterized protein n=1 Tax=Alteribacter keqinensis TaxID=2483800 RepID=A0A3M7TR00_9BACI|nr:MULTISPECIES: hypothetical protein [Alteribacter]MBM7096971.1 hypothetical protein [Alteribacter salitolerans]RNA67450.1 hypothetical protein EBO34_11985 [Alteribacter keqinensis]
MQQQPNQQQGQSVMPQPPEVVTNKDHLYISDMLSWNLMAMKKAHQFSQQCQDQQIKDALDQAGRMHYMHYQKLLTHLQGTNNTNQIQ